METTTTAAQTTTTTALPTTFTTVAANTTAPAASSTTQGQTTTTTQKPSTTTTSKVPTIIVIDPGHSGTSLTTIDPATQIQDEEYCNTPEITDVWDVAIILKAKLEAAGYSVLLTKPSAMATVCKRDRVNVANNNNAAMGVSIHTSGHVYGSYGQIYAQTLASYREDISGNRVYFTDTGVAALSQQYCKNMLAARTANGEKGVVITVNTSWAARGLAPGNVPIMELWAKVPWVFCEAGVPQNASDKEKYAQGLFNGIVASVPVNGPPRPPLPATVNATLYDQKNTHIVKTGTWSTFTETAACYGSYGRSSTSGATATIYFTGTRLDWIAMKGNTTGIADVYLDGKKVITINLAATKAIYQVDVWSSGTLTKGPHTVKIVRSASSASGKYLTLDAVEIWGTIAAGP